MLVGVESRDVRERGSLCDHNTRSTIVNYGFFLVGVENMPMPSIQFAVFLGDFVESVDSWLR